MSYPDTIPVSTPPQFRLRAGCDVELLDSLGDDATLAAYARTSSGTSTETTPERDSRLLRSLVDGRHGSVLELSTLVFRCSWPIFVQREVVRHRVGVSLTEQSGRYQELQPVFWVPQPNRPIRATGSPMRPTFEPDYDVAKVAQDELHATYQVAWYGYQKMLKANVPTEVARAALPVGVYTNLRLQMNLRSLLHFLSLRSAYQEGVTSTRSHPQHEIAEAAAKMENAAWKLFPVTMRHWNDLGRTSV